MPVKYAWGLVKCIGLQYDYENLLIKFNPIDSLRIYNLNDYNLNQNYAQLYPIILVTWNNSVQHS